MPSKILTLVDTPQIRFCVSGSLSPTDPGTNWTVGTPTDVLLTLSGLANAAGRQSDKVDLGATRPPAYEVLGCVDFTSKTPVANQRVDYYWAPSTSGTAANGNVAGNSGLDGAAPNGALGSITLAEFIAQCIFIGSLTIHDGAVVQNGYVGVFKPTGRYGQLIVVNEADDSFAASNVEAHQVFNPIVDESQ
jgi:hypothetical protein